MVSRRHQAPCCRPSSKMTNIVHGFRQTCCMWQAVDSRETQNILTDIDLPDGPLKSAREIT
ncbi:hypothetical protein PoMZ_03081 [Pyricularia oryzae]|uniref:Uncharacterized protein n=1 Tax=Pyricularia oryzae TaxID=318829 RepID=A0A4P7NCC5_PYROR|nr:hypothetical protein PoMZ_03081 [Pyricularia oryzae]